MSASDLLISYKFIRQLSTPWEEWEAYKLGLIDEKGRKLKKADTAEEKKAFPAWKVLIRNIKRFLEKLPFGKTKLGSFAAALWLLREEMEAESVEPLVEGITKYFNHLDVLIESEDNHLDAIIPGKYVFIDVLTGEERLFRTDETIEPSGNILGTNIFEVVDLVSKEKSYITHHQLRRQL